MMFMITMPPTTMPIATTAGITANSTRGQLLPEGHQRVGRLDREIVVLRRPQLVRDAHRLLGALPSPPATSVGVAHLHRDRRGLAPAVEHLERA